MRLSSTMRLAVALGLTVGALGFARAQTTTGPGSEGQAVAVQAPRELNLPPQQQLALARQFVSSMDQSAVGIRAQFQTARAARDVVKSLCLNDKLNQINVAKRTARDRLVTMHASVDSKDKDRTRHEFMLALELRDRVDQIVKEANQCIGEEAGFIGQTTVAMRVDTNIPDNDTDQLGFDPDVISDAPVLSSQVK